MTANPPPFQLRNRIAAALTTACPRHSHCNLMGPAVWAVVQTELEQRDAAAGELATELAEARTELQKQDAEIKQLREQVAGYENGITWHTTCLNCAKLLDSCYAETKRAEKTEAERDRLKKLLEEALHIRQHGERAPGGNENWRDWEQKTERVLRAILERDHPATKEQT